MVEYVEIDKYIEKKDNYKHYRFHSDFDQWYLIVLSFKEATKIINLWNNVKKKSSLQELLFSVF